MHRLMRHLSFLFFGIVISVSITHAQQKHSEYPSGQDRLLPEVRAIFSDLLPPLDPNILKQDTYVGMLTISAPLNADYMDIGTQIVLHNFAIFKKRMTDHQFLVKTSDYDSFDKHLNNQPILKLDLTIEEQNYRFACERLDATNCIEQTIENQKQIESHIQKNDNPILIQRFLQIRNLPEYGLYFYHINDYVPHYRYYIQLSNLRLAQAIFAVYENRVDSALEILQEEMAFSKRVLRQDKLLIGKIIAINNLLFNNYHTLSRLLETPQMKPYLQDPRLLALLEPLTEEEQTAMEKAFQSERNFMLHFLYTQNLSEFYEQVTDTQKQKTSYKFSRQLVELWFATNYDRQASVNVTYMMFEPLIQRAKLPMDEVANLYKQNQLTSIKQLSTEAYNQQNAIENQLRKNNSHAPLNYLGRKLTEPALQVDWESYLQRLYDLQSYILLVNTKHQIISKSLKANEINAYLKTTGTAAQNPITRSPFTWDAKAGTLSTPWLAEHPPSGGRGNNQLKEPLEEMPHNTVYLNLVN